jgi:hypothetical protein
VIFVATKKGRTTNFSSLLSFVAVFGSEIRDPRSGIRDPGSGMDKVTKIRFRYSGWDKHPGSATLVQTLWETEEEIQGTA